MNEEQITRIKFRKGDFEIDISSPNRDFVKDQFKKLIEIPKNIAKRDSNEMSEQKPIPPQSPPETNKKGIENFSRICEVTIEEVKNIYDFSKGFTNIHKMIPGGNAERQREIALLTLVADLEVFDEEKRSGKALSKNMKEQKVNSMSNLAENLKSEDGISMIGNFYRLNTIGKKKAIELVKTYSQI